MYFSLSLRAISIASRFTGKCKCNRNSSEKGTTTYRNDVSVYITSGYNTSGCKKVKGTRNKRWLKIRYRQIGIGRIPISFNILLHYSIPFLHCLCIIIIIKLCPICAYAYSPLVKSSRPPRLSHASNHNIIKLLHFAKNPGISDDVSRNSSGNQNLMKSAPARQPNDVTGLGGRCASSYPIKLMKI